MVDAGGVQVLELFLSGHLYHLILLHSIVPAVAVQAIVALAVLSEVVAHVSLMLGGTLGVFLSEQLGAAAVGPGIVSGVKPG